MRAIQYMRFVKLTKIFEINSRYYLLLRDQINLFVSSDIYLTYITKDTWEKDSPQYF